jgi:hypothetical protein
LLAAVRATVVRDVIAVVADLADLFGAVAANDRVHTRLALDLALPVRIDQTNAGAAIAPLGVAVVTLFIGVDDTVATALIECTRASRAATHVAVLELAVVGTAVPTRGVAVVALVRAVDAAVTAGVKLDAVFTLDANERGILLGAVSGAAIAVFGVAIIAELTRIDLPVTAHNRRDACLARLVALAERLEQTSTVAAITRQGIAVVAFFTVVEPTITTGRPGVAVFTTDAGFFVARTSIGNLIGVVLDEHWALIALATA